MDSRRVSGSRNLRCAASRSNNLNSRCLRASSALLPNQKSMTFQGISGAVLSRFLPSFFPSPCPSTFMELGHVERSFLFHGVSFIFQQACFISRDRENDKLLSCRRITHTHFGLVASLPHNTSKYEGGWQ